MSRDLALLQPDFRTKLETAISETKRVGVHMVPYETERDVWKQAKLWRRSRTGEQVKQRIDSLRANDAGFLADVLESVGSQEGAWATNALPGQSWHQWGLACDLYWDKNGPTVAGGIEWNDLTGYEVFAKIARKCGLTSGFFWESRDAVHVQFPAESKPSASMAEISKQMFKRYKDRIPK
jgi:hypothetical protein